MSVVLTQLRRLSQPATTSDPATAAAAAAAASSPTAAAAGVDDLVEDFDVENLCSLLSTPLEVSPRQELRILIASSEDRRSP